MNPNLLCLAGPRILRLIACLGMLLLGNLRAHAVIFATPANRGDITVVSGVLVNDLTSQGRSIMYSSGGGTGNVMWATAVATGATGNPIPVRAFQATCEAASALVETFEPGSGALVFNFAPPANQEVGDGSRLGTGLSVRIGNRLGEGISVQVYWNGAVVATGYVGENDYWDVSPVTLSVSANGLLNLRISSQGLDNPQVAKDLPLTGWNPGADWRFGLGMQLGGNYWVNVQQLTITGVTGPYLENPLPPQSSFQDIPYTFAVDVNSLEIDPRNIKVTATMSNPGVFDQSRLVIESLGLPTQRILTLTPPKGAYGTNLVTLRLDPGGGGPVTVTSYVHQVLKNVPPTLESLPPLSHPQGFTRVLPIQLSSAHWPADQLTLSIDSFPTNLIDPRAIFLQARDGDPGTRLLIYTPRLSALGTGDIVLRATDPSGDSATSRLTVTTTLGNQMPVALGAGTAISFNTTSGVRQYAFDDGPAAGTDPGTAVTLEAWVYATALQDPALNFLVHIGDTSYTHAAVLALQSDGSPSFSNWSNDFYPTNATRKVALNEWHHVAAVLSGQSVSLYVDGLPSASGTLLAIPTVLARSIHVGHQPIPVGRGDLFGHIDEIRIWSVARTAQEIADNYNRAVRSDAPGLLRYYRCDGGFLPFDGGVGGSSQNQGLIVGRLIDSSLNQRSLRLYGFPSFVPGVPLRTTVHVDQNTATSFGLASVLTGTNAWGSAGVVREVYFGPSSTTISNGLLACPGWSKGLPEATAINGIGLELPPGGLGNFAQRMQGRLVAPETGTYTFAIASANESELYVSPDATPGRARHIATSPATGVSFRQFDARASIQTAKVDLVAGQQYYFQVLHQAGPIGSTTPHLSVQWTLPDGTTETPIPAFRIRPLGTPPAGASLAATVDIPPSWGSVSIINSNATYQPQPNFFGLDEFAYTARNGASVAPSAFVELNVVNRHPEPVAGSRYALQLTGAPSGIQRVPGFDLTGRSFTLELWARRANTTPPGAGNIQALFSFSGNSGAQSPQATFGWFGDGRIGLQISTNLPNAELLSDSPYLDNQSWTHWALVFDASSGRREIYRDGVSVGSVTLPATVLTAGDLFLGSVLGQSDFFQGTLDEVRLWTRARTSDELNETMNVPLVGTETDLFLYYRLDEGNGLIAYDSAPAKPGGVHLDATLINPLNWITNSAPAFAAVTVPGNGPGQRLFLPGFAFGRAPLTYQITGQPANGQLIPDPLIPGAYQYVPIRGYSGTNTVRYTVSAGGLTSTEATLNVDVAFVPIPPTISAFRDQEMEEEDPPLTVPFTVTDEDQPDGARLTFSFEVSNATLLPPGSMVVTGSGTERVLTINPADGEVGSSSVEIIVNNQVRTARTSFNVRVNPRLAYAVVDAGALVEQPSSFATGINLAGQLSGYVSGIVAPTNSNPWFYSGYGPLARSYVSSNLGGATGAALAVNGAGVTVGSATDNRGASQAFVLNPSQDARPTPLGILPGGNVSVATGINDAGLIVGYAKTGNETYRAFTAGTSALTPLPLPVNYTSMWATAVNNAGEIAGYARLVSDGTTNAFLIADGQTQDLGRPTDTHNVVANQVVISALSDQGLLVGTAHFPSGSASRVVTYLDGVWTDLGDMLGGGAAEAGGVNRFGQIVGRAQTTNGVWHAFLYSDGRAHDLNILAPDAEWPLVEARGINDRAQIAANGQQSNGATRAFVLFPATEIGRRVFRPEGTLAENPTITILQKHDGDDTSVNSFHWSAQEGKLFAIRPVVAEIRWRTGTFATFTNDTQFGSNVLRQIFTNEVTVPTLSFNIWPRDPAIHVSGAPVQVEPSDPSFKYGYLKVIYTQADGAGVNDATKLFDSPTTGYSVLWFLRTEGRAKNPEKQSSAFTVAKTIRSDDPAYVTTNVAWTVGVPMTNSLHQDYPGLNGYVLSPRAKYDGAGTNGAYQLSTRHGPILPVNANTDGKDFTVVWYRQDRLGVSWASLPYQYVVGWPTNAPAIVIASQLGTGPLPPTQYPQLSIYNQPDPQLPGYNPNEEHALLSGSTVYALRNDLNDKVSPKASEPFVLIRYLDPTSGEWRLRVYAVVAERNPYFFRYDAVVGREIQPPLPISLLPLATETNQVVSGSAWRDYHGRIYASAAGIHGEQLEVVIRYFYPLQPGFFYNLADNSGNPPTNGQNVAWLDRLPLPGGSRGTPVDITYSVQWPADAPALQVGQSLTTATGGLPDILDMASAQVVFDTGDPTYLQPLNSFARLFDPLTARVVQLDGNFQFPSSVRHEPDPSTGLDQFPDLPYHLRVRLFYDSRNRQLGFRGFVYNPPDGGNPVTLVNVMNLRERETILALDSTKTATFQDLIQSLYARTRNPNRLSLSGDGIPSESLLVGLTLQASTNNGVVTNRVVRETIRGPKALSVGKPLTPLAPPISHAVHFASTDAAMQVGPKFASIQDNFTLEFWVRPEAGIHLPPERADANDARNGQRFAVFPMHGGQAYGGGAGCGVSVGTNGVAVVLQAPYLFAAPLVYPTSLQGWHHVAVVYQDQQPSLYLDGELARVGITGPGGIRPSADLSVSPYTQPEYGPNPGPFLGDLSDLRIWNHSRTASAIRANADQQLSGTEAGLVGLWRFDENGGTNVADASPNGLNGTLVNGVTWATDGPPRTAGARFVVVAENNDPSLGGLPVSLHVIALDDSLARGSLAIIQPEDVLDERVTLRHTADFAGEPDHFVFQWFYQVDAAGFDPTQVPQVNSTGEIVDARSWVAYPTTPEWGSGVNDLTLGTGAVSSLLTLSDVWYLLRYGEVIEPGLTNWSGWIGDPGSSAGAPRAMLVPGWIKRVLGGLNLFAQRSADFANNQVNTLASTIAEAGPRYGGDVALNPAKIDNFGLIEIYSTVLNRGRGLSIDGTPAVAYEPADKALLLAAGNLADLYLLHANEAFASASDPTIGLTTDSTTLGSVASSVFAFQNQLSSRLEEELALLRGRDDSFASVTAPPVYNRLFWNFTGGDGEAAYVAKYGIPDQNGDGFINAADAKILYPQGHGDAWGHYLTALTTYYDLLRHTNFIWTPRPESTLVAGVPIEVNYQDERRFARAAAARARTGAEIVARTHRLNYTEDPLTVLAGFPDANPDRSWSLNGWARRAAQGAYFDWVTGNAILPAVDPADHVGIQKVDRTTVGDLMQIVTESASILNVLDQANAGFSPLGFAHGAVPFDLDPDRLRTGLSRTTHFEQIYERALQALQNAEVTFNRATQLSSELRKQQNSVADYSVAVASQEAGYREELIQIFGYPYRGDLGPGATYPSDYDGPDLVHWMYVPTLDITDQDDPRGTGFTDLSATFTGLQSTAITIQGNFATQFSQRTLDLLDPGKVPQTTVKFPASTGDYAFETPSGWGERRAEGSLQAALRGLVLAQSQARAALSTYQNNALKIEDAAKLMELRYALRREQLGLADTKIGLNTVYNVSLTAASLTKLISKGVAATFESTSDGLARAFPQVVGLADDVFAPIIASIYIASAFAKTGPTEIAQTAELAEKVLALAKEETNLGIDLQVQENQKDFEVAEKLKDLEALVRGEGALRRDVFNANQGIIQAARNLDALLAQGQRLLVQRTVSRKVTAGTIQADRYRDLGLRIFRNDALQKYDAQFEIAARYVHLAAAAYDYELNLGDANGAGGTFAAEILRERSLGELVNGQPVVGRVGLASILGRLRQNFDVLKGQLGLNNDRPEKSRFSLRAEAFRVLPSVIGTNVNPYAETSWRHLLKTSLVSNLWDVAEFRRYCRPFAAESAGPQPGLVLRFGTTINSGRNFFDWDLGPLDSGYDPSEYSTRIKSVAVWFSNYDSGNLAAKPRVYLVPAGTDRLRAADGDELAVRDWQVIDQRIPVPFPIGAADLSNPAGFAVYPAIDGSFASIRRHSAFRAYPDGTFDVDEFNESSRLVGRSVWNTQWVLIIPGAYLLSDPNKGLDDFIQSVDDVKLYFQTYSVSGN